jgi:hypothetical protein
MKLYTKEMFLIAAEKCEVSMIDAKHIMQYIDEYVTAIELPINEDINEKSKSITPKIQAVRLFDEIDEITTFILPKHIVKNIAIDHVKKILSIKLLLDQPDTKVFDYWYEVLLILISYE